MYRDTTYHLIVSLLETFMWDGELVGEENLQEGPGVIVANHMGAIGPVALCCSLPMRLYPWVLGATVDKVQGPENVRKDFVEKVLKIAPPLSLVIARALCKISTPLLLNLGCIPVPTSHEEQGATFQNSIELLKQGKFLLIVPEDSKGIPDPLTGIGPFKRGFLRLGELFAAESKQRLLFYPVAVHPVGLVIVGKPIAYNFSTNPQAERHRMVSLLEASVKSMYLKATEEGAFDSALYRRKLS